MDPFTAAALIGAGGTLISNVWNTREASKNRQFQERMSSTAHQREVADLRRAGINPMLSRMGSGASAPGGDRAPVEDLGRGVSNALQVQMGKAQLKLIEAQTQRESASAVLTNQQAEDLWTSRSGRLELTQAQGLVARADAAQRQQLLPLVLRQAQEEIQMTAAGARAAGARAALDEAARTGALNVQQFEERIGEAGPWVRLLFELLRQVRPR